MKPKIRISHPIKEGEMQVSKWLKIEVLLDACEMQELFQSLGKFSIYNISEIVTQNSMIISKESFIKDYQRYIKALQEGQGAPSSYSSFSSAFSNTNEIFYAMPVKDDKYLARCLKPTVQLRMHQFSYSLQDKTFRSMTLGKETVSWGLQFSYPQIYKHSQDEDYSESYKSEVFTNSILFKALFKWIRKNSLPTPFMIDGKRVNTTFRLGKKCFDWIDRHPQLIANQLQILQKRKIYEN